MRTLLLVLAALFAATPSQSAIDLPRDANGWAILTPSEETQIVYLAASPTGNDSSCVAYSPSNPLIGADPFNPTGDVLECATFAKAHELVQWTGPDWILARRGDTFSGGVVINMSGKSATEPFVFTAYGSTGAMPVFKAGDNANGIDVAYRNNIVIAGIDFYANGRDPGGGEFTTADNGIFGLSLHGSPTVGATMNNILVEGCRFRFFYVGGGVKGYDNSSGIVIRRNAFLDSYGVSGASQGLMYDGTNSGAIIEENIIDHNGWLVQNDGDGTSESGEATIFSQNFYGGGNTDITIRKNLSIRPSNIAWKFAGYTYVDASDGNKTQLNTVIDNNLIVDAPVGISIWGEDSDETIHYTNLSITNNVFTNLGASNQVKQGIAWTMDLANINNGSIASNIVMNQREVAIGGHGVSLRGKITALDIAGNVFHDLYSTFIIKPDDDENHVPAFVSVTFRNNKINIPTANDWNDIVYDYYGLLTGFSFSGNHYYTAAADGKRFRVANVAKTDAQWVALTGDDSTFSAPTFPDATRSIETYMASLGETATIDAFIAKARAQDRYNWDTRFTADAVNDYIRAGFGMSEYTPPGQARRLSLGGHPIKLAEPGP